MFQPPARRSPEEQVIHSILDQDSANAGSEDRHEYTRGL